MHPPVASTMLVSLIAALMPASTSALLQCNKLVVDGHKFDLSKLKGPHSVVTTRYESLAETHTNTTYTVDICSPLKKSGKGNKKEQCPNGTRACAIRHLLKGDTDTISEVVAIAGSLENHGGSAFDYDLTRLKTSDSHSDAEKEGLRLVMKGGKHPLTGPVKERREQRAIIEFLCDPDKTGTEGEWAGEDEYEKRNVRARAKGDDDEEDDDEEGESGLEHQLKKEDAALIWEKYGVENDIDVLRMTWHTKYACEKRSDDDKGDDGDSDEGDADGSSHWGFFTWFVLIVFLGIAAYLIFGSWLNYNRYGARGWDLVPHGDTIRDIPYLMKDFVRRVLNSVQGAGSRGGYSAV